MEDIPPMNRGNVPMEHYNIPVKSELNMVTTGIAEMQSLFNAQNHEGGQWYVS